MRIKKRIIIALLLCILGFIILGLFTYKVVSFQNLTENDGSYKLDKVGQIGDFIGGYTGTLFSIVGIVLLFETLALQRKESSETKAVFLKQQFDNTFFELLKLHKENVQNFSDYDLLGNEIRGRRFFSYHKIDLQNKFNPVKSISKNRKNAVNLFQELYTIHVEEFAIYFKTLYQLYSLIENAQIDGIEQATYSKILRAQLSDGELFFIRYNAMTEVGRPSAHYINVFNILKHLSSFDLMEFKDWWNRMNKFERNGLGQILREIKTLLKLFLIVSDDHKLTKSFMSNRYILEIISHHQSELSITIRIDKTKAFNNTSQIQGLEHLTPNEIENLLKCVLKEFIIYSNYNVFNIRREIKFESTTIGASEVSAKVYNWMSIPLKIHYWY